MLPENLQRPRDLLINGWPFQETMPEVYPQHLLPPNLISHSSHPGLRGSMTRYFSILHWKAVLIFAYNDSNEFLPVLVHSFNIKDGRLMKWSPLGSSLFCSNGEELFVLLTEPSFKEFLVPVDGEVASVEFSPKENYISLMYLSSDNEPLIKLEIRDAKTGKIIKVVGSAIYTEKFSLLPMNYLKWDYNDNYFASLVSNRLVICETKTFSRIKHLTFKQVREFGWSPSASILALFCDSYIKIVDICSGKQLYGYPWERADDYKLLWQSAGDYLACICSGTDYKKVFLISLVSGKAQFITPRCDYIDFAWEGNGKQFAVSCGANEAGETTVNFYTILDDGNHLKLMAKRVEGMIAHYLHWSPNGRYMVMRGPLNGSGELYFYDVGNHQRLAFVHFIAKDFRWDSSGRFFLTRATLENFFHQVVRIWSSHGEKLVDVGPLDLYMLWSNKVSIAAGSSKDDDLTKDMLCTKDDDLTKDTLCTKDGDLVLGKRSLDFTADPPSKVSRNSGSLDIHHV